MNVIGILWKWCSNSLPALRFGVTEKKQPSCCNIWDASTLVVLRNGRRCYIPYWREGCGMTLWRYVVIITEFQLLKNELKATEFKGNNNIHCNTCSNSTSRGRKYIYCITECVIVEFCYHEGYSRYCILTGV